MRISQTLFLFALLVLALPQSTIATTVLIEAESFIKPGGWVVDQQSTDQMGSPYMMAHGLGVPVADAVTTVNLPEPGKYRVWVRTKDWAAHWSAPGAPGKFQLLVDGRPLQETFGTKGKHWHWHAGGTVDIEKPEVKLALRDLTGFNGRCDAILLSTDHGLAPPNKDPEMEAFRSKLLGHSKTPSEAGQYDLVVVGGGMAGCCTAVSATRLGCRVALVQNRPVLGGNNSSEVRVGLSGLIHQQPYPRLGDLVDEIGPVGHWNLWEAKRDPKSPRSKRILKEIKKHPQKKIHNAGPASNYEDRRKENVVRAEKNIRLFLNMHVNEVEMHGDRIAAVIAQNIRTGKRLKFKARLYADCTGDGNLGFLAHANYRVGREPKSQTGEKLAPEQADKLVMGTSVQWYSVEEDQPSGLPACPWALQFDETNCTKSTRGDWDWETGANRDQVADIERIRDYALRAAFGNWAVLKNHDRFKDKFANRRLAWVAYIGGKRESRRLLGDVILRQQDIENRKEFPDACVTTTWTIDLHYPAKTPGIEGDASRSVAKHIRIKPYAIPYRCLYSRNVANLMMAGRNISVTHVALGTVRVQRTTGMMGEALGRAVGLCKKHNCDPRDVYKQHLSEFKNLLQRPLKANKKKPIQ